MKRHPPRIVAALLAALVVLAACGPREPPSTEVRPNAPVHVHPPRVVEPTPISEAGEALKERLARQEEAARLFDKGRAATPR